MPGRINIMKKSKKKHLMKDVYFHGIQVKPPVDPDAHMEETPNVPVALYLKCKTPGQIKYEVFIDKEDVAKQGFDVVVSYSDYEGAEGTSFRSALQAMIKDLDQDPQWDAIIIDSAHNFPPGTREYDELLLIKNRIPVFTLDEVKTFKY